MPRPKGLAPDRYEQILSVASGLMLVAVLVAIARGYSEWGTIPALVWLHLGTIVTALVLTPTMLLRRRGDALHRQLGWVWAVSMFATAALSFGIRGLASGGLSVIHILSAFTLVQVPRIIVSARRHHVARHRASVRAMVTGALLIAGFFTFPFHRLMGRWLFG